MNLSSIHEVISGDHVAVVYCETEKQAADVFTKPLAPLKWPNALDLLAIEVRSRTKNVEK